MGDKYNPVVVELNITPIEAARRLRCLPGFIFLDSSLANERMGRYSYIAADPFMQLRSDGRKILVESESQSLLEDDPWSVLNSRIACLKLERLNGLPPFQGGVAGYWGYDLGRHLVRLPYLAKRDVSLPDMWVGFYDWVVAFDHISNDAWLISTGLPLWDRNYAKERAMQVLTMLEGSPSDQVSVYRPDARIRFRCETAYKEYVQMILKAKDYIRRGDIYQVNLSHRLQANYPEDPWGLYLHLRSRAPAPYSAYLELDTQQAILSFSPERFLSVREGVIETRPIKGTRPRGITLDEDQAMALELSNSSKDKAENLMIVDLLRNDLGKVAEVGSVKVTDLFAIEGYSHVWQMVSTVRARIRSGLDSLDVLCAAFPGGSITGCPKIRAMEIIEELEPFRRGVYCGSIGYLSFTGDMDTSIVIRTMIYDAGKLLLQVGGGIVADSDPDAEYHETMAKANTIISSLGAIIN